MGGKGRGVEFRHLLNPTLTTDNCGSYSRCHIGDDSDCLSVSVQQCLVIHRRQMKPEATVGTKSCRPTSVVDRCVCSQSDAGDDDDVLFPSARRLTRLTVNARLFSR